LPDFPCCFFLYRRHAWPEPLFSLCKRKNHFSSSLKTCSSAEFFSLDRNQIFPHARVTVFFFVSIPFPPTLPPGHSDVRSLDSGGDGKFSFVLFQDQIPVLSLSRFYPKAKQQDETRPLRFFNTQFVFEARAFFLSPRSAGVDGGAPARNFADQSVQPFPRSWTRLWFFSMTPSRVGLALWKYVFGFGVFPWREEVVSFFTLLYFWLCL